MSRKIRRRRSVGSFKKDKISAIKLVWKQRINEPEYVCIHPLNRERLCDV